MGGKFDFSIKAVRHDFTNAPYLRGWEVEWQVRLPHQCDEWSITGHATSKDAAAASLEAFIAEAQATLARLKELPENAHNLD